MQGGEGSWKSIRNSSFARPQTRITLHRSEPSALQRAILIKYPTSVQETESPTGMCFTQRTFLWKISSNFLKFNLIFITVSPLWLKAVTVKGYCWSSVQAGLLRFGPVLHRWRQNVYLLSSLLKFALLDVSSRRQITLTQASMIRSHDSRKANLGKSLHWVFTMNLGECLFSQGPSNTLRSLAW